MEKFYNLGLICNIVLCILSSFVTVWPRKTELVAQGSS